MSQSLIMHPVAVRSERIAPNHDQEAEQTVHLPASTAAELAQHAAELERGVGWCLWMAWCLATVDVGHDGLERLCHEQVPQESMTAVRVAMPLGTWRHVTRTAEDLDRSKSWLLARAWARARSQFSASGARVA